MPNPQIVARLRREYKLLKPALNERARRLWAAIEANEVGTGGNSAVADVTGLSRMTINKGKSELKTLQSRRLPPNRIRQPGGGRPRITKQMKRALEGLIIGTSRGKAREPLMWTLDSTRMLAEELKTQKHQVSYRTVAALLSAEGYTISGKRQGKVRGKVGGKSENRAELFKALNQHVKDFQKSGQPVISVGMKSKKADGLQNIQDSRGWIGVGIRRSTADLALDVIRCWWKQLGRAQFPRAKKLLVVTASGGSDLGHFEAALEKLGQELGVTVAVCSLPRGTSKWSRIEQRLLSFIVHQKRQSGPLTGLQAVVEVIGRPRKQAGLRS